MKSSIFLGLLGLALAASGCERGGGAAEPPAGAAVLSVTVDGAGYHPPTVDAPAGKPVHLVFTRTSDDGCGQQLVFPALELRRDLPLNRAVAVDLTMPASGSIAFTCGMDMLKGSIVAL